MFYGWIVAAVGFLTLAVAFGVRLSFAVFFVALIEEFGWTRAQTAAVFSVSMLVFSVGAALAGRALDRWGARRTFASGAALIALGLVVSSRAQSLAQLMLGYGVIVATGIAILGLGPQAGYLARWFVARRGMAIGLAFAGTGLGTLLLTPGSERLIALLGWRGAYLALALLPAGLVPVIWLLVRESPEAVGQRPDGAVAGHRKRRDGAFAWTLRQAVRTPAFWLLFAAAVGAIGPLRMLTVHQVAAMIDAGIPRSLAAALVGAEGVFVALAFPLWGSLSDRIGRPTSYFLGTLCLGTAILVLMALGAAWPLWLVYGYPLLLGLGEGSRASLVTALASDIFPGPSLGAINGLMGAAFGLGAATFSWLGGRVYDVSGSYQLAFGLGLVMVGVSAGCMLLAARPGLRGELRVC